jgi:hypothetical protein
VDLPDYIDACTTVDHRVNDEDVRDALQDGDSQVVPASGSRDRVLRAKNNCEVREELAREIRYDVHTVPDRMS